MTAAVFVDTNILLYSIDDDPANVAKRNRAQQILRTESWGWSVQVAAEFSSTLRL
jgi:predicted nucleic acid-binding protein